MDELWQRYRTFWVPVLYGVGAFLVGLIVVHAVTPDPEAGKSQNLAKVEAIKRHTAPTSKQIAGAKANAETLSGEVQRKWVLVDHRHGEGDDSVDVSVRQALRAAFLRGSDPADAAAFDGDPVARDQATKRYRDLEAEVTKQLKEQDPNVAYSRFRAHVVQELTLRANRADVDMAVEEADLASVASVDRPELVRRAANLALIATVLDVAIRAGVRSIDGVMLLNAETYGASAGREPFLAEWPVKVDLTGTPDALAAVLNVLTDPARPTPVGAVTWKRADPGRSEGERRRSAGIVRAEIKMYSVRVRPDVPLGLETEGGE